MRPPSPPHTHRILMTRVSYVLKFGNYVVKPSTSISPEIVTGPPRNCIISRFQIALGIAGGCELHLHNVLWFLQNNSAQDQDKTLVIFRSKLCQTVSSGANTYIWFFTWYLIKNEPQSKHWLFLDENSRRKRARDDIWSFFEYNLIKK